MDNMELVKNLNGSKYSFSINETNKIVTKKQLEDRKKGLSPLMNPPYIWYDSCGNKYYFSQYDNALSIDAINFDKYLDLFINRIPNDIEINIDLKSFKDLNILKKFELTRKIKIRLVAIDNKGLYLDPDLLVNLPENIELITTYSQYTHDGLDEIEKYLLRIPENKFILILYKLDEVSRNRMLALDKIAKYYNGIINKSGKINPLEKADVVFEDIKKNTTFDNRVYSLGYRQYIVRYHGGDAIWTFDNGTGICAGRNALMQVALNNRYQNIPCYEVDGYAIDEKHTWSVIYHNNQKIYYDTSFNIKGETTVKHRIEKIYSPLDSIQYKMPVPSVRKTPQTLPNKIDRVIKPIRVIDERQKYSRVNKPVVLKRPTKNEQ